jgi:CrcB protein
MGSTNPMNWLSVAIGGSLGALSRYGIDRVIILMTGNSTISGTLISNTLGSFLLGLIVGIGLDKFNWSTSYTLFLTVGFCGSFTTFSTLTMTSIKLMEEGDYIKGSFNLLINLIVGIAITLFGLWSGRNIF